jgi:hypothetical protein
MGELFNRACTVQMGTVLVSGLRTQFKIEKTEQVTPSSAEITVWNLKRATRARMIQQSVPLVLMAGYGKDLGLLFNGDVAPSGIGVMRSGPDWLTTFKVADGLLSYQTDRVQISIPRNQTVQQVLTQALQQFRNLNVQQTLANLRSGATPIAGTFQQFLNGSAVSGRGLDEVQRICKSVGLRCTVVDGQLEIFPDTPTSQSGAYPGETIPDLTPQTGLIGSPEPTKNAFIKFRCLLRPEIKPLRRVRVVWSVHPEGLYVRAAKVTHLGDTRGQEWYTDVEGTAL